MLPLTAAQILWINLLTDGLPALALAFDRTPGVMQQPPRPADSPLLDRPSVAIRRRRGQHEGALWRSACSAWCRGSATTSMSRALPRFTSWPSDNSC